MGWQSRLWSSHVITRQPRPAIRHTVHQISHHTVATLTRHVGTRANAAGTASQPQVFVAVGIGYHQVAGIDIMVKNVGR